MVLMGLGEQLRKTLSQSIKKKIMPWKEILGALPIAGDLIGGTIDRMQSRRDIAKQNAYNEPRAQLARLREAGLPMAAMIGGQGGGLQSALPHTSGKSSTGNISNFISSQMQLKQLEILKAEIRSKNSEADLNEAERDVLLGRRGETRRGTNLANSLESRVGIEQAEEKSRGFENVIKETEASNVRTKTTLENNRAVAEIAKILKDTELIDKHIVGAEYENQIGSVIARYRGRMSNAELKKLLKENNLLSENIEGKNIENSINRIRLSIERATEASQILTRDMSAAMSMLTYEKVAAEFQNYNQYHKYVQMVQDQIDKTMWEKIKDPESSLRAMMALAYTTITGISGQSPGLSTILQGIK